MLRKLLFLAVIAAFVLTVGLTNASAFGWGGGTGGSFNSYYPVNDACFISCPTTYLGQPTGGIPGPWMDHFYVTNNGTMPVTACNPWARDDLIDDAGSGTLNANESTTSPGDCQTFSAGNLADHCLYDSAGTKTCGPAPMITSSYRALTVTSPKPLTVTLHFNAPAQDFVIPAKTGTAYEYDWCGVIYYNTESELPILANTYGGGQVPGDVHGITDNITVTLRAGSKKTMGIGAHLAAVGDHPNTIFGAANDGCERTVNQAFDHSTHYPFSYRTSF